MITSAKQVAEIATEARRKRATPEEFAALGKLEDSILKAAQLECYKLQVDVRPNSGNADIAKHISFICGQLRPIGFKIETVHLPSIEYLFGSAFWFAPMPVPPSKEPKEPTKPILLEITVSWLP